MADDSHTPRRARQHPKGRLWRTGPFWLASNRPIPRRVGRPLAGFFRIEAAGGVVLLLAAITALVWANSPLSESYEQLWNTRVGLQIGSVEIAEDLRHWVNDAVMAVFFFVVGLEIKHEMVAGDLRDPRAAVVPIAAAFGGMAVPALIYVAFTAGSAGSHGWGIPMATDIAFALGVLAVLGKRIPNPARVFMLTLAIVDDLGAITVIAVFYTDDLSMGWLLGAAAGTVAVIVLRLLRVWSMPVYVVLGLIVWFATYESGVHATIAAVVLGLLTPAKPLLDQASARRYARDTAPSELDAQQLRTTRFLLGESVSVAERLQNTLHPWSSYVVLPVFALANAGIYLRDGVLGQAATSMVTLGVAVGLIVGKTLGVMAASWLAVRSGLGRLPERTSWPTMAGLSMVAGIGFTVSLFITGLAFEGNAALAADAKVGVLVGSLIAALLGAAVLVTVHRRRPKA